MSYEGTRGLALELDDATGKIVQLEAQLAAAADARVRKQTVAEVEVIATRFAAATTAADIALTELADVTKIMSGFLVDAHGLAAFSLAAKNELPSPVGMLTTLLKNYADGVLAGTERPTLPKAAPLPIPTPPPAMEWIFTVRDIAWTDQHGRQRSEHRWFDVHVPAAVAATALRLGAAEKQGASPQQKKLRGLGKNTAKPDPAKCFNLDTGTPAPDARATEPPPLHSAFQVVPRGAPRAVAISATATRKGE